MDAFSCLLWGGEGVYTHLCVTEVRVTIYMGNKPLTGRPKDFLSFLRKFQVHNECENNVRNIWPPKTSQALFCCTSGLVGADKQRNE